MRVVEGASSMFTLISAIFDDRMTLFSRNQLNFFTNHKSDNTDHIFVFFSDEKSIGVKTMRKYVVQPYCFVIF